MIIDVWMWKTRSVTVRQIGNKRRIEIRMANGWTYACEVAAWPEDPCSREQIESQWNTERHKFVRAL